VRRFIIFGRPPATILAWHCRDVTKFAGGVILLILKPFKVGDFIEAQGF
jgi:hypothetical protein